MTLIRRATLILIAVVVAGYGMALVFAPSTQAVDSSQSSFFVPLIGITSVPDPLALPTGPGDVTYHYAVRNFLQELALQNVNVTDDSCGPVVYVEGDANGDAKLDFNEIWRYTCTKILSTTTQNAATATGTVNNLIAVHSAYSTVVVGSYTSPPLVNIVNITKVSYPLSLPIDGGLITYTYRVNNPGVVPLSGVTVVDNICSAMSGKLGDTNGNGLLDTNEVWVFTCTMRLNKTTTNTAIVVAYANGLRAEGRATITVTVAPPILPDAGGLFAWAGNPSVKIIIWSALLVILAALVITKIVTHKKSIAPMK